MEDIFRNSLYVLIEQPQPVSILAVPKLLTDKACRAYALASVHNPSVLDFFHNTYDRWDKRFREEAISPVLKADQARTLIDSIKTDTIVGLRDRAIIALMCYTFARVSAMVHMRVEDYYQNGKRWWDRLHERGGKRHEVPAHHNAEEYLDAYLDAAGIWEEKKVAALPER
jgi:integrase